MSAREWLVTSALLYLAGSVLLYAAALTDARRHPDLASALWLAGAGLMAVGAAQGLLAWLAS